MVEEKANQENHSCEMRNDKVRFTSSIPDHEFAKMKDDIIGAIKTVVDPEISLDVYELGLIYGVDISDDRYVTIEMTLTTPGCPVAVEMPLWVENAVLMLPGVSGASVNLTFDPPWDRSRLSEEALLLLGWY